MSFGALLARARAGASDLDTLDHLARAALAEGEEERALPLLQAAAETSGDPLLWQWIGLLYRSLDEHQPAIDALDRAAADAPNDPTIAHGRARVALEAGLDSVDLFLRARGLAPGDGAVHLGLAAARLATRQGHAAADELEQILERSPEWSEGHEALAQLRSITGERHRRTESIERALQLYADRSQLWLTLFHIHMKAEDYEALADAVSRAASAGISAQTLAYHNAVVAAELSRDAVPEELFGPHSAAAGHLSVWRIRHLLRVGALPDALPVIDQALASGNPAVWPYAAIAWRMSDDRRSAWLERDASLVRAFDLTPELPPLETLARRLRSLHVGEGEYLDQSVRGGTQTDGPLLSRIDPVTRQLRRVIMGAIAQYKDELPKPDPRHPLLGPRRDRRIRFSGSWSVRLSGGGRHANHVHPQGWISSALYVELPDRLAEERADSGYLVVGEPPEDLRLGLAPIRTIEPRPGTLVLFPSWMWHGTVPFERGERLTVAFDVRPPI